MYIFLALIGGSLVVMSMLLNAQLGKHVGKLHSALANYTVGFLVVSILFFLTGSIANTQFTNVLDVPWWGFLGGVIGGLTVVLSNIIIPRIPVIFSALLIFLGQLFTGILLDWFMGRGQFFGKIIGGILIALGLLYNGYIDKKEKCSS